MNRFQAVLSGTAVALVLVSNGCMTHRPAAPQGTPRPAAVAASDDFNRGMACLLQGDLQSALPLLRALPAASMGAGPRRLRDGILARFTGSEADPVPAGLDAWTVQVLAAYRTYWKQLMLREQPPALAESSLAMTLTKLLDHRLEAKAPPDLDALEAPLLAKLERHGCHGLLGVTSPFRELLLWRGQTESKFDVDLPDGREQVTVVMLSDFASLGWLGYATLDQFHTGGWTRPDRLYCVAQAYDLGSESFRISYLAHEGQHFRDNRLHPGLKQPELEYRAKLVEVALADQTLAALLAGFQANQSSSRDQPHAFANRRLMEGLSQVLGQHQAGAPAWWSSLPPADIRAAARRLLAQDTKALLN